MEKTEKTLEQLEAEYKKAAEMLENNSVKLDAAKKELAANSEDEKLKKKVEGLSKAVQVAQDKLSAAAKAVEDAKKAADAQQALKDAQEKNAGGETGGSHSTENAGDKNPSVTPPETPSHDGGGQDVKKIRIRCRSKTGKPSYFRAGLRFTPVDAEYEVTEEVAEILKNDPWLDVKAVK